MQRVAPTAVNASRESIRTSVVNRDATPASISKIGRVPLAHFAWFVVAYNVAVAVWQERTPRMQVALTAQIALGTMNVILLTPVWLQIAHLLVAEIFWVLLVSASADQLFASNHSGLPLFRKESTDLIGALVAKLRTISAAAEDTLYETTTSDC